MARNILQVLYFMCVKYYNVKFLLDVSGGCSAFKWQGALSGALWLWHVRISDWRGFYSDLMIEDRIGKLWGLKKQFLRDRLTTSNFLWWDLQERSRMGNGCRCQLSESRIKFV